MVQPLVVVDTSAVREGMLVPLQAAMDDLVRFVEANEPRVLSYSVHFDEQGTRMTVVQVHPDSASMELHLEAAAPLFSRVKDLVTLETMDVYGAASEALLDKLRRKARMLGTATLVVHPLHAGIARFDSL